MLLNLAGLLQCSNETIRKEACFTLSNITAGSEAQVQLVCDSNLIAQLVALIGDCAPRAAASRSDDSSAVNDPDPTRCSDAWSDDDAPMSPPTNEQFRAAELATVVGQRTRGNASPAATAAAADEVLLEGVKELPSGTAVGRASSTKQDDEITALDKARTLNEAVWALANMTTHLHWGHISHLVDHGVIQVFADLLGSLASSSTVDNSQVLNVLLNTATFMLRAGAAQVDAAVAEQIAAGPMTHPTGSQSAPRNAVAELFDQAGIRQRIKQVQDLKHEELYQTSAAIIATYYTEA